MPQDAFTLKYLSQELNSRLKNGKINKIVQLGADELIFTVYVNKHIEKLFISASPACPRITIVTEDKPSPLTAPNFCMLLRKHLLSATINDISLVGFDRIVRINLTSSNEFFDGTEKNLYVELMGRYSNLILTENGKVLGCNRGLNFLDNEVRPLIVGLPYNFPPNQGKKLPSDASLIEDFKGVNKENCAELICSSVMGISTQTASEIAYRFHGLSREYTPQKLYEYLNEFINNCTTSPCVLIGDNGVKDFSLFPYKTQSLEIKEFLTLCEAENYYFNQKNTFTQIKNKKERATALVNTQIKKIKKRISAISSRQKEADKAEENNLFGELILANIYKIKQGDERVVALNYYNGEEVVISLDKKLSPSKNAEAYYKKYNKQKRSQQALKPQMDGAVTELEYYQSVLEEISIAETEEDFDFILEELNGLGLVKNFTKRKKQEEKQFRVYLIEGYTVKVGRNNIENDKLVANASSLDVWLHAKDYHSSHVIIENKKEGVPGEVITKSAEICAYYSKGREGGKCEVVYTNKKFVKKPKGAKPGFCTYTDYKSITVTPNANSKLLKSN